MSRKVDIDWFKRGRDHQMLGRPIDAMLCFRRAIGEAPRRGDARFHLGEVQWALGLVDAAKATWREVADIAPRHLPSKLALAEACLNTGDAAGAKSAAEAALARAPGDARAHTFVLLANAALGASGVDWNAIANAVKANPALLEAPARADLMAVALDRTDGAAGRDELLEAFGAALDRVPLVLLASVADHPSTRGPATTDAAAGAAVAEALHRGESRGTVDAWRRLALAAQRLGDQDAARECSARYSRACIAAFAPAVPVLWPRRTAGEAMRVALLVKPDIGDAIRAALKALDAPAIDVTLVVLAPQDQASAVAAALPLAPKGLVGVGAHPDPAGARLLAVRDPDVLIDSAGLSADAGPWLAQRPGRVVWTLADLEPPLVDACIEPTVDALTAALAGLRREAGSRSTASELFERWSTGLRAQQAGNGELALASYAAVLEEQPDFAPARQFRARLAWDAGDRDEAARDLAAAIQAAPAHADLGADASRLALERNAPALAAAIARDGLSRVPGHPRLLSALGHALLKVGDGAGAVEAFQLAMAQKPIDAEAHYNLGVAHQLAGNGEAASRSYQHALAFDPTLVDADFNLGVLFQQQGRLAPAIAAYRRVLDHDPARAAAWKNIGEIFYASARMDEWAQSHRRFEKNCPESLLLAAQSLEFYQLHGDFAAVDRTLDGLRLERYRADDDNTLVDALEELLYLLLFFDIESSTVHRFARTYDQAAKHVYGLPRKRRTARTPGKLRIGYLSADLRDHVMGKMMWEAVSRHDRGRFDVHFYSMNARRDEWTAKFENIANAFRDVSALTDRDAAQLISGDDLDVLVDLQTHTKFARPGILALRPARVQITHVASAGTLGLSVIDWKLTDAYADLPDSQESQVEPLLAMDGCVYPYRAVAADDVPPLGRTAFDIPREAVVIGAFVTPLKLSRRCLTLWKEIADRVPNARFAFSPLRADFRDVFVRLMGAAGIAAERLIFVPQGRNDEENQARYRLVDLVLDPMPFGNVNGTIEPLAMGVPVVTLVGKRHGERTGYSILSNLGLTSTIAQSGREYVELAVRLATDEAFMREVRESIATKLPGSPLADLAAHARNLEAAYVVALARSAPEALASAGVAVPVTP